MSGIINEVGSKSGTLCLYSVNRPSFFASKMDDPGAPDWFEYGGNAIVDYNYTTFLDTSNGRATVKIPGLYWFSGGVITNVSSSRIEIELRLNNTTKIAGNESTYNTNYGGISISGLLDLNRDDYITLFMAGGTCLGNHAGNYFTGYYLSPSR